MPSQQNSGPAGSEGRAASQPPPIAKKFWKTFLKKMAITARLAVKQFHRVKIRRVDLARADLRLGQKAYATSTADGQVELLSRLDRVAQRLTELRQQRIQAASTLGEKAKVLASRIGKAIQIGALKLRRRRILRQLGAKLRQSGASSSLTEETRSASAVADRIGSLDAELRELAPQTYPWARRPLLLICLLLLLAMIAGAFGVRHQFTASLAQQKKPDRSSLSDEQMNKVVAQQQAFQQQMQQMVAEATRRETEQRQARIAAAERQYREQRDRERAEVEKRQREAAAEQQRVAAAERARQEAQQREEERRVAEEKARQEQQRQREAQEQRAKAEALARAEQQTKQEVRKVAKAFVEALERNDMRSASSLASGDEKQLALAQAQHDFARSFARMQLARAKKFGGDQASTFFDPSWSKAEEHIEGDKATVNNGMIGYQLQKSGQTWKVNLPESSDSDLLSVASSLTHDIDEIARKVEKGDYKNDKEAEDAFEAKLAAAEAASGIRQGPPSSDAQSGNASPQSSRPRSETSLAVERYLRFKLVGGMTDKQIVEISDLIAEKFDAADLPPKERGWCISSMGEKRFVNICMLGQMQSVSSNASTEAKRIAKELTIQIADMIPPRAMFHGLWDCGSSRSTHDALYKPLAPIDGPINSSQRPPGSLAREYLVTFQGAIYDLAGRAISAEPRYTEKSPLNYFNQVQNLKAGDVLCCKYQTEEPDSISNPYYFWYGEPPADLEELLKTLPADHPIRLIGPPHYVAPANLELAMKANPETAETVKKRLAEERARAEKEPPTPKGTSYERGRDVVFKALGVMFAVAVAGDIKEQHDAAVREEELQKEIAESSGTKVRCPECKGSRGRLQKKTNVVSSISYPVGQPWGVPTTELQTTYYYEKCDRCDGKGWVYK